MNAANSKLRVLIAEDSDSDTEQVVRILKKDGFDIHFERVCTAKAMEAALTQQVWDVIVSDYNMPGFDALEALSILKQTNLDIPFILVSGTVGEETAVMAMKAGAHDYLMKDN